MVFDNPFYSHEFHGDYELISVGRLGAPHWRKAAPSHTASSRWPRSVS